MSLTFTVTLDAARLDALAKRLAPAEWRKRASASVLESTLYLEREIARRMRKRTGAAAASVLGRRISPMVGRVASSLGYVTILEEGSRPHVIRPRNAKVLAFPSGGRTVFARSVNHPGTRGYHAFRDGVASSVRAVEAIIARHLGAA